MNLEGTVSNRDGIGSLIEIYHNETYQNKYTFCGEGYLAQNSETYIFGLGSDQQIDSLRVTWPSGIEDVYYDLPLNQAKNILEGETISNQISYSSPLTWCGEDSVTLNAGEYETYLWSNGHDAQFLTANNTGEYFVTVVDSFGLEISSDTIIVQEFPAPVISPSLTNVSCYKGSNGSIVLTNFTGNGIADCEWSNGMNGASIDSLEQGSYQYFITDNNNCMDSGIVSISQPPPLELIIETTPETPDNLGEAIVEISGGTPPYHLFWSNGDQNTFHVDNLNSGTYALWITDANNCLQSTSFVVDIITGINSLNAENLVVYPNPFHDKIKIRGLSGGFVEFFLYDISGSCQYQLKTEVSPDEHILEQIEVGKGLYLLKIDTEHNHAWFTLLRD